ncbi:MAG: UDP-N-acetylmuramoyl-L-alanyl-D-glutamate--2,6-diaminopimelate ligase [Candidatus Peregrinibacteria bacterium Greene0416_19]|nr:MAG: UDP-N-acetylmuramoyl-L-alanyl-D-glutamate--2,6-diaminopimelate ligase [Candidatus Peregrinibacteria bacterium Greene0416_19]
MSLVSRDILYGMTSVLQIIKGIIPARSPVRLAWHRAKGFMAALRYGFPARRLTVIGITGTDGKTTTVNMVAHILSASGIAVGALSTASFQIRDDITWNTTQKTSPSPFIVQSFLRRLLREGCTHAVLEYSSHGLVQGRTHWTWPSVAAITNTSPEHLDYHGTMEQYRKDKGILFRMLGGRGVKVLSRMDGTCPMYMNIPSERTVIYAVDRPHDVMPGSVGDLWLEQGHATSSSSTATVIHARGGQEHRATLTLGIPGTFNLENALCAIGCALGAGIGIDRSVAALSSFRGVPGRMERIDGPADFAVFVDFTVTPASYEKTLSTMKSLLQPGNRLLVLTGSCGDRMKEKRPQVGKICSQYADVLVVSNEDPYTEDPEKVIDDVWAGVDQSKTHAHRISDRMEAIKFLFCEAKPGDIILLCGKGSDTMMWVKEGQIPWNEREIAKELLRTKEYLKLQSL